MKSTLLFVFICCTQILSAQLFTEDTSSSFYGSYLGEVSFSDVDGDNDNDVLFTGWSKAIKNTVLYVNNGKGKFTEKAGTIFERVNASSLSFLDVDGDNDDDVLLTGSNNLDTLISKLYINDGQGTFTEVIGVPFERVKWGALSFSDVDGDGDNDILLTGRNNSIISVTELYLNDGQGNFTKKMGTPFDGVSFSSTSFSDVDGDNDDDVLITGRNNSNTAVAKLYLNDGQGNFTEMMGTPFDGVMKGAVSFSDVDGDNNDDVLLSGKNAFNVPITKLYLNDGQGNFTQMIGTTFVRVHESAVSFSDVDGDDDNDFIITGRDVDNNFITKLYVNSGQGNFTEMLGESFEQLGIGSVSFSDVDGDTDDDVIITGVNITGTRTTRLYFNNTIISSTKTANTLQFEFALYPNPTQANQIAINVLAEESRSVNITVFSLDGRTLHQQQESVNAGANTFSMDISSLSKGSYMLQLDDGERKSSQLFLVQ